MLRFAFRLLGFIVLLALIRIFAQWLYNLVFGPAQTAVTPAKQPAPAQPPDNSVMIDTCRDPVCGAFVSPTHALKASVGGREQYFCSAACRDKFLAA
jgi:YHS domain-containing protein